MQTLSGFGFRGFRSFYGELQVFNSLTKVNLIAGQNNSGKSNVLRVVQHMQQLAVNGPQGFDVPRTFNPPRFELVIRLGDRDSVHADFCEREGLPAGNPSLEAVRGILADPGFDILNDGGVWLKYSLVGTDSGPMLDQQATEITKSSDLILHYLQALNMGFSSDARTNAISFLAQLERLVRFPQVQIVPASRRIDDSVDDTGTTLVQRLAALQNPEVESDKDRERFEAIIGLLRTVTGDASARLEVPYSAKGLNVRSGDLVLPLENLGTGISQVIMIAASATIERDTVVCMEEPEVHLHPLLQRKLLRYLNEETDNQYIIATHSAHILDSAIASVYHAKYTDSGTTISFAGKPAELSEICYDLGYRPSDLLQTNCVIWVEGPSDRIYISYWLYLMNPELREGIHYSIMFYGGRLLNHLSADDPEISEFIKLRRLNRHLAVVMDSDRPSRHARVGKTKARVQKEIEDGQEHGLGWVTEGRYIESYIPREELTRLLGVLYPEKRFIENANKYTDALRLTDEKATWTPDKIRVAKEVCKHWKSGLNHLDLYKQILALAELIETANQGPTPERPPKSEPQFECY